MHTVKRISGISVDDIKGHSVGPEDGAMIADFIESLYAFGLVTGRRYGRIEISEVEYQVENLEEMADRMYCDFVNEKPV